MASSNNCNDCNSVSNYIDNTLYRCKKKITFPNYVQHICSWKGAPAEYIQHVKSKHEASYFIISNEAQKFQWKLPFMGDQIDLGIFQHNLGHFLYEIYFKKSSGEIYFSLAHLDKFQDNYRAVYKFSLHNCSTKELFVCQANTKPGDMLKPIHEQTHKIIISKNVASKFLNQNRIFQWYVSIISTRSANPQTETNLFD